MEIIDKDIFQKYSTTGSKELGSENENNLVGYFKKYSAAYNSKGEKGIGKRKKGKNRISLPVKKFLKL